MKRGWLTSCLIAALAATARGEEPPKPVEKSFLLHPAKPPTPALRIRLLPSREEQIAGDAAPFYHRALESLIGLRHREEVQAIKEKPAAATTSAYESAYLWLTVPLDKLPKAEAAKLVERRDRAIEEARLGSLRETCDWGFRRRNEGFMLLLPEIQDTRELATWIALRARLDMEEGRIEDALRNVKTGLSLARDVGRSDSYIQSLVAVACGNQSLQVLEELIQKPSCPNLYWALASLPRPFLDMSGPTEAEATMLSQEIPMLGKLEGEVWSIEMARSFADVLATKLGMILEGWPRSMSTFQRPALQDLPAQAGMLVWIARDYHRAKGALLESGVASERLAAMPMIQVVGMDSYRTFQAGRDDFAKWSYLPAWQGARGWAAAEQAFSSKSPGIPFLQLVPAARSAFVATTKFERRLAVLQAVEALRLYAATHGGDLPTRLDDLVDSPAPFDPVTGGPFAYKRDGDRAFLSGPAPLGYENVPNSAVAYEIRIAR
ncbi:hypothetical protein [Paludisphaera mucosa]|uniref:Uncharacterized protein n=1 Tax=Paludisphaera mucosa TaxID=3030827 RepID=A0ABT6F6E8_9BACT|nr:hypothetical protein [Paludisphaera mucosa]MDG3003157.1 hypothetical protein [Paludisphaera mucosa]